MRAKLQQNHRCIYLGSPSTLAALKSYLAGVGINVKREVKKLRLVLSSDQKHVVGEDFHTGQIRHSLESCLRQALSAGHRGLWASRDMAWETGPHADYSNLLEYERLLEDFLRKNPSFSKLCQYHVDTLPRPVVRHGLLMHQSILVSEYLSMHNPYFRHAESYLHGVASDILLDAAIDRLCQL